MEALDDTETGQALAVSLAMPAEDMPVRVDLAMARAARQYEGPTMYEDVVQRWSLPAA